MTGDPQNPPAVWLPLTATIQANPQSGTGRVRITITNDGDAGTLVVTAAQANQLCRALLDNRPWCEPWWKEYGR